MHILDFIMYIVLAIALWYILDLISDSEYTEEMGCLIGGGIELIFTIIYIVLFCFSPDLNWSDIFQNLFHADWHLNIKW